MRWRRSVVGVGVFGVVSVLVGCAFAAGVSEGSGPSSEKPGQASEVPEGSRFDLVADLDILGHFQLQMVSAETAENYIIAEGSELNQVRIASWPRGEF